jgi:hypothetical protein
MYFNCYTLLETSDDAYTKYFTLTDGFQLVKFIYLLIITLQITFYEMFYISYKALNSIIIVLIARSRTEILTLMWTPKKFI